MLAERTPQPRGLDQELERDLVLELCPRWRPGNEYGVGHLGVDAANGRHINADIADAVVRYLDATEDTKFEQEVGLELLVETARLWRSLGQHDAAGRFRIEGVTGPDEYSAVKDNNVYTNLMAQRNLAGAADLAVKLPDRGRALGVTTEEVGVLAGRGGRHVHPVRRPPRRAPAARGVHRLRAVGLQEHRRGPVPAAAALPVLPAVPQAGGQAGGPGAGHVHAAGRVHARAEGQELRLLRAADRARLLPVGLHPGAWWRPRWASSTWPTTTWPRPR